MVPPDEEEVHGANCDVTEEAHKGDRPCCKSTTGGWLFEPFQIKVRSD